MENAVYERHSYKIYQGKGLPFISHSDYLIPNSFRGPVHWHENPEFLRCNSGNGKVFTAAEHIGFAPNDIITVNPNDLHSFSSGRESAIQYDCLIIDALFCEENGINLNDIRFESKIQDLTACEYYDKAFKACMEEGEFYSLTARTYVLEFLLYMCCNHITTNEKRNLVSTSEGIKKTVTYIRNNYMKSITLSEAADVAGLSDYYFARKFKKVTGFTFVTFLNIVRCENAVKLLQNGVNVTDACFACGFNELSYFSRTFSKLMGVAPSSIIKSK